MIPARLAMALQDSGWILRHDVVWDKGSVRPEAVTDRVTRTHEFAYMFAKNRRYFYDQDPLRIPVVSPYSMRGRDKPGLIRRDENRRDLQVISNPLGTQCGISVVKSSGAITEANILQPSRQNWHAE